MPTATSTPEVHVTSHPTPCPAWCKDRRHPLKHSFGPSMTPHWSPQYRLANPTPLPDMAPVIMRAELYRLDEGNELDEPGLYVSGESDVQLSGPEADIFIGQMQAFVDGLRVLRAQMEAVR